MSETHRPPELDDEETRPDQQTEEKRSRELGLFATRDDMARIVAHPIYTPAISDAQETRTPEQIEQQWTAFVEYMDEDGFTEKRFGISFKEALDRVDNPGRIRVASKLARLRQENQTD